LSDLRRPLKEAGDPTSERWQLVERVAASRHFVRAPQLREFLLFVSRKALFEDAPSVTETEIGSQVLRRRSDFDPSSDNIVRVQARHLRQKLGEYFGTDGRDEPLVLTIPKGTYVPQFQSRPAPEAAPEGKQRFVGGPALATAAIGGFVLILASVSLWLWQREARRPATDPPGYLWSLVSATGLKTYIVLADSSLVALQNILRLEVTLDDYLMPEYPGQILAGVKEADYRAALTRVAKSQHTSLASAISASRLQLLATKAGVEVTLRFARHLHVRDLKSNNFILIGSRRAIPWVELFEHRLNFVFEGDPKAARYYIRNKTPQPGERAVYELKSRSPGQREDFAAIAVVPNLGGNGIVVLLQGVTGEATEAAGELVAGPEFSALLQRSAGGLPEAEFVVRTTAVAGAPAKSEIVASRVSRANAGRP